ncbi:MAG: outer membrane beta-barrel protein, partial [Segetibacter sp.]
PYASSINASVSNQSTTGSSNTPVSKLTYKSGFSYGFGIYLKSSFGKRTGFTAGLNYHYLSAASLVGNRNSGSQTFYANLQYSATANQYFNNGESVKYTNSYHLVELPLNFLLQLNKKQNKAVFITAGLSPAYLAKSNALYASSSQNIYYATSDQFKKWQFAAQAGLQVNIMNTRQLGITAGPQLQYGLNNMTKQVTGTSQHLVSASLKLNVNLK